MRNPYATVSYFRTTIYLSFMLTDISLCACYLFACARVRFIFNCGSYLRAILVAHNFYFDSVVNLCVTVFLHSP